MSDIDFWRGKRAALLDLRDEVNTQLREIDEIIDRLSKTDEETSNAESPTT